MVTRISWIAIALAASLGVGAAASPAPAGDPLERIVEQQRGLQRYLGNIEGLTQRQRITVQKLQVEVFRLMQGKSTLAELSMEQKVRLENALERINAEIADTRMAHERRETCRVEKKTGTKIGKPRCMSADERNTIRLGSFDYLERPRICRPPGCGEDLMDSQLRLPSR